MRVERRSQSRAEPGVWSLRSQQPAFRQNCGTVLPLGERNLSQWIEACAADDIAAEDVLRFDHGGKTYAIYRSPDDKYYATDGLCTHEKIHLADGLVMDNIIECPKHNGRFDYRTGEAKGAPVCVNLKTYAVRLEGGKVLIDLG